LDKRDARLSSMSRGGQLAPPLLPSMRPCRGKIHRLHPLCEHPLLMRPARHDVGADLAAETGICRPTSRVWRRAGGGIAGVVSGVAFRPQRAVLVEASALVRRRSLPEMRIRPPCRTRDLSRMRDALPAFDHPIASRLTVTFTPPRPGTPFPLRRLDRSPSASWESRAAPRRESSAPLRRSCLPTEPPMAL
jgi:hypothetical protein